MKQQLWLCFWAPIGVGVPPPLLFRDGESKKEQSPCSRPYVLVADGKSPSRICVHREPEPLQIRESKPLIPAEGVNASSICVHREPGPLQISGSTNARTLSKKFPSGTPYFACGSQPDILHKRTSRASENTMSPNMVLAFPRQKMFLFF